MIYFFGERPKLSLLLLLLVPFSFSDANENDKRVNEEGSLSALLLPTHESNSRSDVRKGDTATAGEMPEKIQSFPDESNSKFEFGAETESTTVLSVTEENGSTLVASDPIDFYPWVRSPAKVIFVIALSFIIPFGFMFLVFCRLQKEKKYLRSRPGALVYRETIIVPSYSIANQSGDGSENSNSTNAPYSDNAVQMHAILYDTPPTYENAVKTTSPSCEKEKGEVPPPPYASIHF